MIFKKQPYTKIQLNTVFALRLQNKDVHQIATHMGISESLVTRMTIKLMSQNKLWHDSNEFKQLDFNQINTHKPKFKFQLKLNPDIKHPKLIILTTGIFLITAIIIYNFGQIINFFNEVSIR